MTLRIWSLVSPFQNTWPVPALYFIELGCLGIACAVAYARSSRFGARITWVTVGVLAAFSILGAWTVGLYYLPVMALFLTLALISYRRNKGGLLVNAAVGLFAAITQATAMVLLVQLL